MIEFNEEEKRFMKELNINEEKLLQRDGKKHDKIENLLLDLINDPESKITYSIMSKLYLEDFKIFTKGV